VELLQVVIPQLLIPSEVSLVASDLAAFFLVQSGIFALR
jgi:hypothetical protein